MSYLGTNGLALRRWAASVFFVLTTTVLVIAVVHETNTMDIVLHAV